MSNRGQIVRKTENEAKPVINPAPAPTDPTTETSSTPAAQPGTEQKSDRKADSGSACCSGHRREPCDKRRAGH